LTPPQIGVSPKIILIFNTPHASKIFVTPTTTFEKTHVQLKFAIETCIQPINNTKLVEGTCATLVYDTMNQPIEIVKTDYI
jgi:hypothetical protein